MQQTRRVSRNTSPTWDFDMQIAEDVIGLTLGFEVWDKDTFSPDDLLGRTSLRLGPRAPMSEVFVLEVPLSLPQDNVNANEALGFITVRLKGVRPAYNFQRNELRAANAKTPTGLRTTPGTPATPADLSARARPLSSSISSVNTVNPADGQNNHVPEDQLMRSDPQHWALLLLVMAMLLVVYCTGSPFSCVIPDRKETDFSQCQGLYHINDDHLPLKLPQFCWTPCTSSNPQFLLIMIGIGVLAQSFVVVVNLGHFSNFCRWTFYFDLWDLLQEAESKTTAERVEDEIEEIGAQGGSIQRNMFRFVRKPLAQGLDKAVKRKSDQVGDVNVQKTVKSSARQVSLLVKSVTAVAALHVGFLMYSSFSLVESTFSCQVSGAKGRLVRHMRPKQEWEILVGVAASEACLVLAFLLVNNAKWAIHLKVWPANNLETAQKAATRLSEHFKEVSAIEFVDQEEEQQSDAQRGNRTVWVKNDDEKEYIPKCQEGLPEDDFKHLTLVEHLKLAGIRYKGTLYQDEEVKRILEEKRVPKLSREEVTLLFRPRNHHTLEAMVNDYVFFDKHRCGGIGLLFMAAAAMLLAFNSCWTCVRSVSILDQENITSPELADRLSLFGACGSYGGVGNATFLSGVAFLLAALQQLVILVNYKERKAKGGRLEDEDQLRLTVLDFRKNANLDISRFERGYVDDGQDGDDEPAYILSYLWVTKEKKEDGTEGDETVKDARTGAYAKSMANIDVFKKRGQWMRSQRPRKVRLVKKSDNERQVMSGGLERGSHGMPSICVEVLDEKGKRVEAASRLSDEGGEASRLSADGAGYQQMVPVEFIAGFFHAELNLGPTAAWEAMATCLVLVASFLTFVDLCMFFFGPNSGSLSTCKDIKNEIMCSKFALTDAVAEVGRRSSLFHATLDGQQDQPAVSFRSSLAPLVALCGVICGILGMMAARVSSLLKFQKGSRGSVVQLYCQAMGEGLDLLLWLPKWTCDSCRSCCLNTWCYRIIFLKRGKETSPHEGEYVPVPGASDTEDDHRRLTSAWSH